MSGAGTDMWEIGTLLAFAAVGWLWFDSLRARERAMVPGPPARARARPHFLPAPPGGTVTMMRTGFAGKAWAIDIAGAMARASTARHDAFSAILNMFLP